MNSLMENEFPLHLAQGMRYDLLNLVTDDELAYKLPGDNLTLGALCREMGETEYNYLQSFKTLKYDATYRNTEPGLETSRERLAAWYKVLDEEFEAVMGGFSNDDLQNQRVERVGWSPSLAVQFMIFHEAVLMFYAKASIYLKALQKPYSEEWRMGVG
jgi:hypothetical protein